MAKSLSFEENVELLENIIDKLEKDKVPLSEALKLYNDGVKLVRQCNDMLDKAEKQVKILDTEEDL